MFSSGFRNSHKIDSISRLCVDNRRKLRYNAADAGAAIVVAAEENVKENLGLQERFRIVVQIRTALPDEVSGQMKKIPTGINSKSKMELYEIDEFKHFYHEDALILGIFRCDLKYLSALKFPEFRKITLRS